MSTCMNPSSKTPKSNRDHRKTQRKTNPEYFPNLYSNLLFSYPNRLFYNPAKTAPNPHFQKFKNTKSPQFLPHILPFLFLLAPLSLLFTFGSKYILVKLPNLPKNARPPNIFSQTFLSYFGGRAIFLCIFNSWMICVGVCGKF